MLCADLADAVRQQFRNPHRKQMLMDLLGPQFKRSYLADETETPSILVCLKLIILGSSRFSQIKLSIIVVNNFK